jgi:DNA polymerase-3 subunit alpha
VIQSIIREREEHGRYQSLKDFIIRVGSRDVNKRAVENFIKAGTFDGLEGNRRQKMLVFPMIMDQAAQERKNSIAGQMSLFDLAPEEEKQDYEISMPNVPEYEKEELLAFEKEVLGIYISGHPLEQYEEKWRKNITAVSTDFLYDEEQGGAKLSDGARVMIGGMITERTVKFTKQNKAMAFLTIEDLYGTTEVVVFPRDYEKYQNLCVDDAKVFVFGHVDAEEEKNGKLICQRIYSFDDTKKELWLQFSTKEDYANAEQNMYGMLRDSDGGDAVVVYISGIKAVKRLPANWNVSVDALDLTKFYEVFGEKNVKVVEKAIENPAKRD